MEGTQPEPSTASKTLALQLETEALCGPEAEACTVLVTCHYRRLLRAIYGPGNPPRSAGGDQQKTGETYVDGMEISLAPLPFIECGMLIFDSQFFPSCW